MVTEQPQYSVDVCIFQTLQNTEISLIPNGLRFIFTYLLLLTFAITFHTARHTMAMTLQSNDIPREIISQALGHSNLTTTATYLAGFSTSVLDKVAKML